MIVTVIAESILLTVLILVVIGVLDDAYRRRRRRDWIPSLCGQPTPDGQVRCILSKRHPWFHWAPYPEPLGEDGTRGYRWERSPADVCAPEIRRPTDTTDKAQVRTTDTATDTTDGRRP